jgi:hypothetical protein
MADTARRADANATASIKIGLWPIERTPSSPKWPTFATVGNFRMKPDVRNLGDTPATVAIWQPGVALVETLASTKESEP